MLYDNPLSYIQAGSGQGSFMPQYNSDVGGGTGAGIAQNFGLAQMSQQLQQQQTQQAMEELKYRQAQAEEDTSGPLKRQLGAAQTQTSLGSYLNGLQAELGKNKLMSEISKEHLSQMQDKFETHYMQGSMAAGLDQQVEQAGGLQSLANPALDRNVRSQWKDTFNEDLPDDPTSARELIHAKAQNFYNSKQQMEASIQFLRQRQLQQQRIQGEEQVAGIQAGGHMGAAAINVQGHPGYLGTQIGMKYAQGGIDAISPAEADLMAQQIQQQMDPQRLKDLNQTLETLNANAQKLSPQDRAKRLNDLRTLYYGDLYAKLKAKGEGSSATSAAPQGPPSPDQGPVIGGTYNGKKIADVHRDASGKADKVKYSDGTVENIQ